MFRLLRSWVGSGTHRSIAALIVMTMAATGVATTIDTDSIDFLVTAGTAARTNKDKQRKLDFGQL